MDTHTCSSPWCLYTFLLDTQLETAHTHSHLGRTCAESWAGIPDHTHRCVSHLADPHSGHAHTHLVCSHTHHAESGLWPGESWWWLQSVCSAEQGVLHQAWTLGSEAGTLWAESPLETPSDPAVTPRRSERLIGQMSLSHLDFLLMEAEVAAGL